MSHPLVLSPYMLSSNQVLNQGRYRIINQFGNLESDSLYEAYDTVNETKVVLHETVGRLGKVATATQIENLRMAFAEDAKRLTEVEHPSFLKVNDYFSEIDRQYLVIEACDASNLAELVEKQDKSPAIGDILRWADQLLDGLEYLHSRKPSIVHQKVSPQNIRLTSNFKVKLLVTGPEGNGKQDASEESAEPADQPYRALEQLWLSLDSASQKMIANSFGERSEDILRQPADARTDLYSAGATLYYLLTRTAPSDALARYLDTLDGNQDPLQKPKEIDPSIPAEVSDALMKAMELKREYRFESAAAMRGELSRVNIPANSRLAEAKKPDVPVMESGDVEQNRLEDESLLVEKERMELNAEQKHLEDERSRIEKRKLELEAEKKRQADLLEANRRQEEEKQKADKLKAEKTAVEQKAQAERLAPARLRAEVKEKSNPSTAEKNEVENLQLELAKDDLLDLPEPALEISVEPEVAADVLALDVEQLPSQEPPAVMTTYEMFSETENRRSFVGSPAILVGVAVVALVAVIGFWMFAGSGSTAVSPNASVQTAPNTSEQVPETQSAGSQPTVSIPNNAPQTEQPSLGSPNPQAFSSDVESKSDQMAKQKLHKQPTPQTKPTPEKKKAVTVDDLINDN